VIAVYWLQSDIMQAVSALDRELDVVTTLCLDALCAPAFQPLNAATINKYLRRIRAGERALRCAKETVKRGSNDPDKVLRDMENARRGLAELSTAHPMSAAANAPLKTSVS